MNVRETNVVGLEFSFLRFQNWVVVDVRRPPRHRVLLLLEECPPVRAQAVRHLTTEIEKLATLRHLVKDSSREPEIL